jgi:hypothetical protein
LDLVLRSKDAAHMTTLNTAMKRAAERVDRLEREKEAARVQEEGAKEREGAVQSELRRSESALENLKRTLLSLQSKQSMQQTQQQVQQHHMLGVNKLSILDSDPAEINSKIMHLQMGGTIPAGQPLKYHKDRALAGWAGTAEGGESWAGTPPPPGEGETDSLVKGAGGEVALQGEDAKGEDAKGGQLSAAEQQLVLTERRRHEKVLALLEQQHAEELAALKTAAEVGSEDRGSRDGQTVVDRGSGGRQTVVDRGSGGRSEPAGASGSAAGMGVAKTADPDLQLEKRERERAERGDAKYSSVLLRHRQEMKSQAVAEAEKARKAMAVVKAEAMEEKKALGHVHQERVQTKDRQLAEQQLQLAKERQQHKNTLFLQERRHAENLAALTAALVKAQKAREAQSSEMKELVVSQML